jgi:predicted enzyme related to lactoylglutathione lyase
MPKTEIPKMGWFAVALDPEGNGFGIFETKGM